MIDKLDWSRLDGNSFQRLCNDLLVAEIRDPRFIPYAPGGKEPFDARFEGAYGGLDGRWGFDAKFRSLQPRGRNVASLKTELSGDGERKGLLRKAEEDGLDILVLLTNVRLTERDRRSLEALAEGRRFQLLIWDEERLRALLTAYPHIRLYHFRGPTFPLFQPPHGYYGSHLTPDEDRFISHLAPLQGRDQELELYRMFVGSNRRVLTVYAAPGMGKSRLLLEYARVTESGWIPLFLQPEGKVVEDHLAELSPNRRYMLFIDDAHRHLARLGEILWLLTAPDYYAGLKVVMASRIAFRRAIEAELAYRDPGELAEPICLHPMEQKALESLLRWQLPDASASTVEMLAAAAGGSAALALAAGRLLLRGEPMQELLKPGALRRGFLEAPIAEFFSERGGPPEEIRALRELLLHLAALSPLDERDGRKWPILAEWVGIPLERVRELSEELREAGFLQRIGRKLTVVPEILGDYLISAACLDSTGGAVPEGRERARRWFELEPEQTLINCADLSFWFPGSGSVLLREIFDALEAQAISGDRWERTRLLGLVRPVASRFPREALDLVRAMLDRPLRSEEHGGSADAEVRGEMAPVLGSVAHAFEYVEPAMELLRRLVREGPVKTIYGNHQPEAVLADVIGFGDKPLAFCQRAVEVLERWWREDPSSDGRLLTLRVAAGLLRPAVQMWRGTPTGFTISSAAVSTHREIRTLRWRALALTEGALTASDPAVRAGTYRVLREWLRWFCSPAPPAAALAKAAKMVEEECLSLLPLLEERVARESDLTALAELEDLLWTWWLRGDGDVVRRAGSLLPKIPRSEEFTRYRLLIHPGDFGDLAPEEAARATTPKRRSAVYGRAIRRDRERWTDHINQLAGSIRTVFPAPCDLLVYLDNLLSLRAGGVTTRVAQLLFGVGRFHSEYASALLRDPDFQNRRIKSFTDSLLRGIKVGDPHRFGSLVSELAPDVEALPADALEAIIAGHAWGEAHESDLDFLQAAATRPEGSIRKAIALCLPGYLERFRAKALELLLVLARPPVPSNIAEGICDVLCWRPDMELHPVDLEWAKQLFERFVETPEFGPEQYHCRKLHRYVAQADPPWYLNWIDRRFAHMTRLRAAGSSFDALPSTGLREIVAGWEKRPDYSDLLRRIRNACRSGDPRAHDCTRLFAAMAQPYASADTLDEPAAGGEPPEHPSPVAEVLGEWTTSGDATLLSDAADLIGELPRNGATYSLMVEAVSAAEHMGEPVLREVEGGLSKAFVRLAWSRKIGEPSQTHLSIVSDLDGLLGGPLPRPARRFFERMRGWIVSEMDRHRVEDEERLAGVD